MDKQVIDTNYFWKQKKKNLLTLFAAHTQDLTSNSYLPDGGTQVTQGLMETGKPSLLPADHTTEQRAGNYLAHYLPGLHSPRCWVRDVPFPYAFF